MQYSLQKVDATIRQESKRAVFATGAAGAHTELVRLLGRMRCRFFDLPEYKRFDYFATTY